MKKIFKKNQIIITALAVMIAAAGYVSYSDSRLKDPSADVRTAAEADGSEDLDSVMEDLSDKLDPDSADGTETDGETPGEAVLTGASTYMAQARVDREQIRSQNKETLLSIINNTDLTEEERQGAIASMVNMTDLVEKEAAAELLLEAKGFPEAVVNLTGETADVVVPMTEVDEASRAQIEDIVTRKTGIAAENIVISPVKSEEKKVEEDGK